MEKNWKDPAKGCHHGPAPGVQMQQEGGRRSFFPSEGKPKADLLEEQVQKEQIQTLLGHVRGLNKGQQAHVADGDVQLGLFHQMLQRGDSGSLLGGFLWLS